jgi:uncharacterized protein GlcG (DUF336 family)
MPAELLIECASPTDSREQRKSEASPVRTTNNKGTIMAKRMTLVGAFISTALCCSISAISVAEDYQRSNANACSGLPGYSALKTALQAVVSAGGNGGLGNDMWATVVNRDGIVCNVVFTGQDRGDQWPGSRVISAQKANTANAFSRPSGVIGFAGPLSTANLYSAVQPGGSLFGLQESNPVLARVAYQGNAANFGQPNDPLRGERVGGVNVFGGGLALYNAAGNLLGGIGVSGDTSCTDHIVAWKLRFALNLDNVPGGVSPTGDDNIIHDVTVDPATGHTVSAGGFGHPACDATATTVAGNLPKTHPVGAAAASKRR